MKPVQTCLGRLWALDLETSYFVCASGSDWWQYPWKWCLFVVFTVLIGVTGMIEVEHDPERKIKEDHLFSSLSGGELHEVHLGRHSEGHSPGSL